MPEWYETFFDALANDVWRALVPDVASDAEADFLAARLGLARASGERVIDLGCGEGRLALRLAARGTAVTGLDLSADAVDRLRQAVAGTLLPVRVVEGDLRAVARLLGDDAPWDGAYCMGNSFGYLDPPGTRTLVEGVASLLAPGAHLVIDHASAAECMLVGFGVDAGSDRYEVDGTFLEVANSYDAATSTMIATMTLGHDGTTSVREARHRLATVRETVDLLGACGFDVVALEGDLDATPFALGSPRLFITARRR